jgi:SsrA-binding protein
LRKKKKKRQVASNNNERTISENRKARHEYHVLESLECGIVLVGSEVKSLRSGTVALAEAYGRVRDGEVWLVGCDIPEYVEANRFNHKPKRDRKLLLHRREIERFAKRAYEKGLTLVPLRMYFKEGKAKVLLGLCKGKQEFDKRNAQKKAETAKALRLSMMHRR